jgi:hypothetical protein
MFAGLPPSSSELSNGKALFRHLLLQIGGANIENPPSSSSLAEERTPPLAPPPCAGARFPTLAPRLKSCSRIALCWMLVPLAAMFARLPPSSSELTERKSVVPPSPPADRRREHRESAAVVVARRRKKASARSSVRRRAIPDARTSVKELLAHDALNPPLAARREGSRRCQPQRAAPQPRWIWIRREAASAEGFGIRISKTPSL